MKVKQNRGGLCSRKRFRFKRKYKFKKENECLKKKMKSSMACWFVKGGMNLVTKF